MKLYLDLDNYDYQPERYKYAVEQMMLTLFPEERPEYPPREGRTLKGETNAARFTLRRSPVWTTVRAQVYRPQGMGQAAVRVGSGELDRPPEQVYHTLQHALKMAFYQAGTALLGGEPPWGALTGVQAGEAAHPGHAGGGHGGPGLPGAGAGVPRLPRRARLAVECARASLAEDRQLEEGQVSLYIGIPFCPTRCAYCSFVSADVGRALKLVDPYVEALLEEVRRTGQVLEQAGLRVRTLYVGGGTPTTLSASAAGPPAGGGGGPSSPGGLPGDDGGGGAAGHHHPGKAGGAAGTRDRAHLHQSPDHVGPGAARPSAAATPPGTSGRRSAPGPGGGLRLHQHGLDRRPAPGQRGGLPATLWRRCWP